MARVAFAWELGGEYGHVVSCAGLAGSLHRRGHSIALMFRDLSRLGLLPETASYDVFESPHLQVEGAQATGFPLSYADILLGCGYSDPAVLTRLLEGWRALLTQWKPDLMVADYAPTALLAARTLGIPRVTFGNGFFNPPRQSPLPPFRIDEPVDPARIARSDARALATVNSALAAIGEPALERLEQQFEVDEDFLCTFPELDHYGTRATSGYWGPRIRADLGHVVDWPRGPGRKVFVYVKTAMPQIDALIDALAARRHRVLAFIPGLDEARRTRLASPSRRVLDRPVRMDSTMRDCDLLICHGGEIGAGALCLGVPGLLFPQHYEQFLSAIRLQQLGCGAWLRLDANANQIATTLDALLDDSGRAQNAARAFAARYPAYSPAEQRRRIVQRIEAILSPSSSSQGRPQ